MLLRESSLRGAFYATKQSGSLIVLNTEYVQIASAKERPRNDDVGNDDVGNDDLHHNTTKKSLRLVV